MKSLKKNNKKDIKIEDIYALKIKALLASFNNQHMSFKFICLYIGFEYIRPQSLYPSIDILPWSQLLLILSFSTLFFDKTVVKTSNRMNKLFGAFGVVVLLSSIFAFNPEASWDFRNTMLGWILVYFIITKSINSEARLVLFILAYLLFNLKMGQHGVFSWANRGFSFASYGLIGAPGWFRNSGEYAIQMLIFGSLALAFVFSVKDYLGRYKKLILFAAASTGYITVIGASSRGSQVALAVMSLWFLAHQKNGLKGMLALSIISLLLYSLLPDEQLQRFTEMGEDDNSLQRLAYWEAGFGIIKDNPLIGVGYHNWLSYMRFLYPDGLGVMNTVQESHNIYIQAASELGITGLIVFILMIVSAFSFNSKSRKNALKLNNKLYYNLSYGLDAGLIGYLVAGSFVTVLYYPFFWIQISLIIALYNVTQNSIIEHKKNSHLH